MNNLLETIKKNKVVVIVAAIIWVIGVVFVIAPLTYTVSMSYQNGVFNSSIFAENLFKNMGNLSCLGKVFSSSTIGIFAKAILYYSLLFLVLFGIGLYKGRKKSEYDKIEHGSSDWSQGGEQYRILSKNSGLILAENNYLPLNKVGNVNVLIVGGSGSGKSSAYTIPNAHQLLGSYIFTDPKGEIYDATAGYLKEQGYEIKLLNLVDPNNSDSYNPLHHIKSNLDVDVVASTIIRGQKGEKSGADPFWDNMSELLLKALIFYLLAARPEEEQNLASCAELVRAASINGDSNLLSEMINKLPYDHPARMNFKSVELASEKTYSSILSSLQSSLGKFDSEDIANVTSTNTINFEEIATKKTALYVVSSDTHTAYDFLLTIFFSQMIQHLYDFADKNGGKLPIQTFFILDEFANIGQIPDFDKKISTSRSRGISFSVILQNLDQLKGIYEKSYETIIGNCDTHVFLGSNSYATVEYFSKELGEKTITHNSKSTNRNNSSVRQGYSESNQIMARALMTPDELRRMDNKDCIIFEKGLKPIMAKKYFWYTKNHIIKDLNGAKISHNDYNVGDRGEWRKINPYKLDDPTGGEKDIKVESLDDLFEDLPGPTASKNNEVKTVNMNEGNRKAPEIITQPPTMQATNQNNINRQNENKPIQQINQTNSNEQNKKADVDDEIDIQKELEAKFDELFGTDN